MHAPLSGNGKPLKASLLEPCGLQSDELHDFW
jgi:hypothetical protein